jgi:hypothetical protein
MWPVLSRLTKIYLVIDDLDDLLLGLVQLWLVLKPHPKLLATRLTTILRTRKEHK